MASPTRPAPRTSRRPGDPRAESSPRRSRENTRARLVEAAADVFAEKSLRKVTVDDVVGAAGFTRGAFYSNYSAIEELFFDVTAHQAEQMLAVVDEAIDAVPAGEFTLESLRGVFAALHPFGRRWFLLQNEFALLAVRDPGARERFAEHAERFQGPMEALVGRTLTLLDREPVVPLADVADVMLALYLHSLGTEQTQTGSLSSDRLVSEVLPPVVLALSRPRAGG